MKQSRFVIAIAVLMLSACGDKSEKEPTAAPVSPPLVEHNTPVITDPPMACPHGGQGIGNAIASVDGRYSNTA